MSSRRAGLTSLVDPLPRVPSPPQSGGDFTLGYAQAVPYGTPSRLGFLTFVKACEKQDFTKVGFWLIPESLATEYASKAQNVVGWFVFQNSSPEGRDVQSPGRESWVVGQD
jgi:hypothetical protein